LTELDYRLDSSRDYIRIAVCYKDVSDLLHHTVLLKWGVKHFWLNSKLTFV